MFVLDEVCHDFHRQYNQVDSTAFSACDSQSFSHSKVFNIYFRQGNFINRKQKHIIDALFLRQLLQHDCRVCSLSARAHQGNWQPQRNSNFREFLSAWFEHMLLNGAAQIEETALPFTQFALLHSVTCAQLRLIRILGNCGCVAVASFLGVPSP
jgi:hypothetical protein